MLCIQVLDENYELGNIILPMSMILLQYCPSPQRYASDYQPPNYTVWLLEPMIRHCWLMALLVILYKVSLAQLLLTRLKAACQYRSVVRPLFVPWLYLKN